MQQRQIDFNKGILVANTAIAATNAAVNLGKAIGDYHEHKANLKRQELDTQVQGEIRNAITSGETGFVTEVDEDGTPRQRFTGFGDWKMKDGRTIQQAYDELNEEMNSIFWTKGGAERARQMSENSFANIALKAQAETANKVVKDRQEVFNQEMTNAVEVYRQTGDATELDDVIDRATWMSEDENKAVRLGAERQAQSLNALDEAKRLAINEGNEAAREYLRNFEYTEEYTDAEGNTKKRKLSETQIEEYLDKAMDARNNNLKIPREELDNFWRGEMAGFEAGVDKNGNALTLAKVQGLRSRLQSQKPEFERTDNMAEYERRFNRLRWEEERLGGSRSGLSLQERKDQANWLYSKWAAGELDGLTASDRIYQLDVPEDFRIELMQKMRSGKDGVHTEYASSVAQFEAMRAAARPRGGSSNNPTREQRDYDRRTAELRTHMDQMRFAADNAGTQHEHTPAGFTDYAKNMVETETANLLRGNGAIRDLSNVRRMAREGKIDYMHYTHYDEYLGSTTRYVGNNAEQIYNQFNAAETQNVTIMLEGTGWEIEGGKAEFEKNRQGDRTGDLFFNLRNGDKEETVRVGLDGNLEKRDGENWVSFEQDLTEGKASAIVHFERDLGDKAEEINGLREGAIRKAEGIGRAAALSEFRRDVLAKLGVRSVSSLGKAGEGYLQKQIETINAVLDRRERESGRRIPSFEWNGASF